LKIVFVYADSPHEINCSLVGLLFPAEVINKTTEHHVDVFYIEDFRSNGNDCEKKCLESDIIVVERNLFGDTLTMMQYYKVRNKNVAVYFDDSYPHIDNFNASYLFWHEGKVTGINDETKVEGVFNVVPHPISQFRWGNFIAKGIIVPSVQLAKDWSKYAKTYRSHIYLNLERYKNEDILMPHEDIIIGGGGSISHLNTFLDCKIFPAFKAICETFNNVRILTWGDKRIYDLIDVPENKKIYVPFVEEGKYSALLRSLDIGVAPLATEFDMRRSWLKPLEFSICKVPWIASDLLPYSELRVYGKLVKNTKRDWEYGLSNLILNLDKYKEKSRTDVYRFALEQSWDKNIYKLIDIFEKIINSKYKE